MTIQYSVTVRNARADAVETAIGTAPTLELRSGAPPASCAAADSGTLLASMALPSDWMAAASSGSKSMLGTWEDLSADAGGTFGHYRIKQGATCHEQGTASGTGGGGDIEMNAASVNAGQTCRITSWTRTEPNA